MLPEQSGHLVVLRVDLQDSLGSYRCVVHNRLTQEEVLSAEFNIQLQSKEIWIYLPPIETQPRRAINHFWERTAKLVVKYYYSLFSKTKMGLSSPLPHHPRFPRN